MPNQAMTYTPDVVMGDDGQEHLSVDSGTISTRSGGSVEIETYEDENGNTRYRIDEEDYQQDGDYQPSNDEQYIEAIFELYPNYEEAMEFYSQVWSEEQVDAWNQMVDRLEPDELIPAIEEVMAEYDALNPQPQEQATDITEDDVNQAYAEALDAEPQGDELAYNYMEVAVAAQEEGDACLSGVAALTAAFHRGEITAAEAYEQALSKYDINDLARVYQLLNN